MGRVSLKGFKKCAAVGLAALMLFGQGSVAWSYSGEYFVLEFIYGMVGVVIYE